jgi:hypothetical protein
MGRASNQMVTYTDLQWLVDNLGFVVYNSFSPSNKCSTKAECSDALILDETAAEWIALASNQLVPYRLLVSGTVTWVGIDPYCEQDSPPVDELPTAPTIVLTSKNTNTISVNWTSNPGTDDNGIVSYDVQKSEDNIFWETPVNVLGTTHTYTNLVADTTYYFRVAAIDTAAQYSPFSNTLTVTTDDAVDPGQQLDIFVSYDVTISNGARRCYVIGAAGETVTMELTITGGSSGSCSKKWLYWRLEPSFLELMDGADFPSFSQTFTFTVTLTGASQEVAEGHAYRGGGQVGFEAATTATIKILSSTASDGNGKIGVAQNMDVDATGASGC